MLPTITNRLNLEKINSCWRMVNKSSCARLRQICIHLFAYNVSTQQDTLNENFDITDMVDLLSAAPFNRACAEVQLRAVFAWTGHKEGRQRHIEKLLERMNLHTISLIAAEKLCTQDYPFLRDEKIK